MGDPANPLCFIAINARLRRPLAAHDALDVADQAPQALRLLECALNASLGPDHIALGRRIGQHEPPRRVGAVSRDDLIRVDGIALGLRHLLVRTDLDRRVAGKQKGAAIVPVCFDATSAGASHWPSLPR